VLALAASLAACGGEPAAAAQVEAVVARSADTIRFQAPAVLYRCAHTADLVLEGVRFGNGVLVWLRLGDSLVREFPIIGVRDTITRPGAVVAVRYSHEAVGHTLSLDSGMVVFTDTGAARRLAVTGSGLDVELGARSGVAATFGDVPEAPDSTTSCARMP
jgi:hypothetical protein